MNLQNNFNRQNKNLQDVLKKWDEKILPHLPENLEELVLKTGALQRKRGIRSATDLLKILFIYACQEISFRMLAAAACALGISAVSDTSLRKHVSKASSFLHEILSSILSSFLPGPDMSVYGKMKNVLLVDASVIRQDGKKQEQQADVILRITPKTFCLYDADRNKIPLVQLLKKAEKNHQEIIDIYGFCQYRTKKAFVRVIAGKLPEEQAEKSRKRKKRTASRKQNQITEETLFCAGWIVVITSLGTEYCGEEILHLYRSRWQMELLFKRFKQNFSITTLKAGNTNYAATEVLLGFIIWVISERQSFLVECFLKEKNETADDSVYEKCKVTFLQIKEILCLSWSQFIDITDKKYSRYLSQRKRYRKNQNDEFHTAILPGLLA